MPPLISVEAFSGGTHFPDPTEKLRFWTVLELFLDVRGVPPTKWSPRDVRTSPVAWSRGAHFRPLGAYFRFLSGHFRPLGPIFDPNKGSEDLADLWWFSFGGSWGPVWAWLMG